MFDVATSGDGGAETLSEQNKPLMRVRCAALVRYGICIVAILALFVCARGLWWMAKEGREAASISDCHQNIHFLGFALQCYHNMEGAFPPAFASDPDGKPLCSWRVLISPYCDERKFFDSYNLKASWDDKANLALAQRDSFVDLFACLSDRNCNDALFTNYVAIVGPGTIFPGGGKSISLSEIADGAENTILLVEIANSDIHWSEPRDLRFDQMSFSINDPSKPSISSSHEKGPCVLFADGRSYRIAESISPKTVKALVTINGGEGIRRDELVSQGLLD